MIPIPTLFFTIATLIILGLIGYWLIMIGEGAFLGRRAVMWLYDRGATTYDGVKEYDDLDEAAFLGNPLFARLEEDFGVTSLTLDVATGTARLPLALLVIPFFEGTVVGVDQSIGMLREARRKCVAYGDRAAFLRTPAVPLPFNDDTFDAVTCLESLEFMPDRAAALGEMVRVLRPGGWLIITNRRGLDRWLLFPRVDSPAAFERRLARLGLTEVFTRPWQEDYDLIFARLPGVAVPVEREVGDWQNALRGAWQVGVDGIWQATGDKGDIRWRDD